MARIPGRYAPFVYGVIQAAITTAVASAIATQQVTGLGPAFIERWVSAWALAWLTMLPVVILISPVIQRAVMALTACGDTPRRS